jgi:hypothetical protein
MAKTHRVGLVTLAIFSVVAATLIASAAAESPPAQVMSVHAMPTELPAGGGTVIVNAILRNATACHLQLLSQQDFPVVYATNVRSCSTSFTARITIGRNPSPINRTVAFELMARGDKSLFTAAFYLTLAGSPPVQINSVTATPTELPAGGGTVVINGILRNATTCHLQLLSQQDFPVVYATNVRSCSTSFTARVTIGRNPTPINRNVSFALSARGDASLFTARFYVTLAAGSSQSNSATPPTTAPPTTPPTTSSSAHAALQAWVDNTLDPEVATLTNDLGAINNCNDANGDDGYGCESYGSQLESDATSAESGPEAPNASVESAWSAYLTDNVNIGTDTANDDFSDLETALNQAETDINSLIAVLAAQGLSDPEL